MVYDTRNHNQQNVDKDCRRLEIKLDDWEAESLISGVVEVIATPISGTSSLRLGYSSIRMLLYRVKLLVSKTSRFLCYMLMLQRLS